MVASGVVVVTDRGGHLHDALRLIEQLGLVPQALLTTVGPDVAYLKKDETLRGCEILHILQSFSWIGKLRLFNPFRFLWLLLKSFYFAAKLRPKNVVSTGAGNVIPFCYFAKLFGARIHHVENLAQVVNPSITGRVLYPIADAVYVQWDDLLSRFGSKAKYAGWVL